MADSETDLVRRLKAGAERARARRAEENAIRESSMRYIEAVEKAGQRIFGVEWIGELSAADQAALRAGTASPVILRASRLRQEQIAYVERWLASEDLVDTVRGSRWVPREPFETALRARGEMAPAPRPRRFGSQNAADNYVEAYIASELAAGRHPTGDGAEKAAAADNYKGARDLLRNATQRLIQRGAGRPKKVPCK